MRSFFPLRKARKKEAKKETKRKGFILSAQNEILFPRSGNVIVYILYLVYKGGDFYCLLSSTSLKKFWT